MSGSGPGPSDPTPQSDSCLLISKVVALASPNPPVLATLSKNDVLVVSYNGASLDVLTQTGNKCGVAISDVTRFIECIKQGHEYIAVVVEVSGAKCTVQIRIK